MAGTDTELGLVALAAMLSPTTLSFSILALVLSDRPLRTGSWFLAGAFGATMAAGVVAAVVIGDVAASPGSSPKTWVAVLDVVFGVCVLVYAVRTWRAPPDRTQITAMIDRMTKVASAPAVAIVGAGAMLANPGGFIPIALKRISETGPSAAQYLRDGISGLTS